MNRTGVEILNDWWWHRLPVRGGRFSSTVAAVLLDGLYCAAWPALGCCVLPLLFLYGLVVGWNDATYVYMDSYALMALLLIPSLFGSAFGTFVWVGYVFGGLLVSPFPTSLRNLVANVSGRLLADMLLMVLLVVLPVATQVLARHCASWFILSARYLTQGRQAKTDPAAGPAAPSGSSRVTGFLAQLQMRLLIGMVLVYLWVQADSVLLQGVFILRGDAPRTHGLVQAGQELAWMLAAIAAWFGGARFVMESLAGRRLALLMRRIGLRHDLAATDRPPRISTRCIKILSMAAVFVFLLAGTLHSWFESFALFVVFGLILTFREFGARMVPIAPIVERVPAPLRIIAGLIIVFSITWSVVSRTWSQDGTFLPVYISVAVALAIFALLVPARDVSGAG